MGDTLWVGTASGLLRLDGAAGASPAALLPVESLAGPVATLAADGDALWVGADEGLFRLAEDGRLRRFGPAATALPAAAIEAILVDREGSAWIGTTAGLVRYRPAEDAFDRWHHVPDDPHSLAGDRVRSIYQDRTGVLWFGTWTGGISRVDLPALVFSSYDADGAEGLPEDRVRDFVETPDGAIWVATLGGGLARLDPATGRFSPVRHDPADPATIGSDQLHAVALDGSGHLWVGSRDAGVSRYDPRQQRAERWPHVPGSRAGPAGQHVLDLLVDRRDRLWIGTQDDGISRLDLATGRWDHYRHDPADDRSLPGDTVGFLFEAADGRILVGTRRAGLAEYRPATDDFLRIPPASEDPGGLRHGTVSFIDEAAEGALWVATQGGGIARMVRAAEADHGYRFAGITTAEGLAVDAIGAVLTDAAGAVWLSTLVGISRYEPATGAVRNFYGIHGAQPGAYYMGAGLRASDGRLYFGGYDGITHFLPRPVPIAPDPPQVVLTRLLVANEPVPVGDPGSLLPVALPFLDEIALGWRQQVFTVEFAGLHFTEPARNRYAYRLLGFSDGWTATSADRRFATYTNLDPGRYRFEVRAANRDGVWSAPASLAIRVEAPPWRSNVALMAYVLTGLTILSIVGWLRSQQLADRRAARREVERTRERLDLALWGSGDDLWYLDVATGTIDRLSSAEAGAMATEEPIVDVATLLRLTHPDDRAGLEQQLERHLQGQRPEFEATYRLRGADGQWLWILSRGRAVERDPTSRQARVIAGASKDITQLKNTERALRELNERLESMVEERTGDLQRANADLKRALELLTDAQAQLVQSEKMASLGNLVAGVAHEINTPVGVALTAATYLQSQLRRLLGRLASESAQEAAPALARQLENIDFLIQNLLRAAELIKGFKQVAVDHASEERRRFRVHDYLEEILRSLQPRLKRTRHEVHIDADPSLEMDSFPGALYQIFTNLVLNSLIHGFAGKEQGTIAIDVRSAGDRVRFTYRDDGAGFGPDVEEQIFEPFFTTRRDTGGSGLGMHIAFKLATTVLGGSIACRGIPGEGIRVELDLPAVAPGADDR